MNSTEKEFNTVKEFKNASNTSAEIKIGIDGNSAYPDLTMNAIAFMQPTELTQSAWLEHIPFAFWLTNAHKPRVLVELGTHYGSSYFAFCQAIEQLRLPTRSYAIDAWKGDEHAGFYGENVYGSVHAHNTRFYSRFSTLMRTTFDEGANFFKEGEIDLLHIDGYHTYEAVKHDFDTWLPKLSSRGVVIIHDSNERKGDFGVFRFVEELRHTYPCFEFAHGHGLTVVGVGAEQTPALQRLFAADNDETQLRNVQEVFARLGKACLDEYSVRSLKTTIGAAHSERDRSVKEAEQLRQRIAEAEVTISQQKEQFRMRIMENDSARERIDVKTAAQIVELEASLTRATQQLVLRRQENEMLRDEARKAAESLALATQELAFKNEDIRIILNSSSWRLTAPVRATKRALRSVLRRAKYTLLRRQPVASAAPEATHVEVDREWYLQTYPDVSGSGVEPEEHYLNYGKAEGRYPTQNAFLQSEAPDFDAQWYLDTYTDVARAQIPAVYHYITHGQQEGRFSSLARLVAQDLDIPWYLEAYPDVATSGMDPFEHFLLYGHAEGRQPSATPRMLEAPFFRYGPSEYGAKGRPLLIDAPVQLNEGFARTIGVHLHLYYVDLADEFIKHLNTIPTGFDLFISLPRGKHNVEECERQFRSGIKTLKKLVVRETENKGRDIYPFIVEFGPELLSYELILHIHSKKSPQALSKGWRRFLLHYTLGTESITTQILNSFDNDPKLGVLFPAYFYGVTRQPNWGGNREIVKQQLARLGFTYDMTYCPDYPAGSFFWSRSDALRPLLNGEYRLEDFDEEAGQYDGTLAHGFERLFGTIPLLQNYSTTMRFVDRDYRLINYFDRARLADSETGSFPQLVRDRNADIDTYQRAVQARGGRKPRIALVTAIIGPFDALLLPKCLESDVDYHCFSDSVTDGYGVFQMHRPPYIDADARRSARYIKTNLLKYIENYDYVVWIDANVELNVPVSDLVERVALSERQIGAIKHPIRDTWLEEAEEILALELDDPSAVSEQIGRYKAIDELSLIPLIESNVLVLDAREQAVHNFMKLWWNEINTYSRRDQISISYALNAAGVTWYPLLEDNQSVRDSEEFALYEHGLNQWGPQPHIYASWHTPVSEQVVDISYTAANTDAQPQDQLDLDVVVCVHNALDDVRACLASLDEALQGRGNIILVDDASAKETEQFLAEFAVAKGAKLIRQEVRLGYTRTANNGVRGGSSRNVLLLNSDTIVPAGALEKLCHALDSQANLGVVGPLSNAASTQSVPSIKGTATQTAINALPDSLTPADIDHFFETHWDRQLVRVPLVHGFCFAVKREVFDAIGLFDEESFPHGYGEENDFCFRVSDAGFDLAVLTNTYIYHAKSKSYASDERTRLMDAGMQALIRKYSRQRIERSVATMNAQPKLELAREQAQTLYDEHA